jgi:acetyl esterase/lipase
LPVCIIADQVYSRVAGRDRLADLFIPQAPIGMPVVVWLHGGGWRFGDRHLAPNLAAFSQASGLAVVSIDYRLSDEAIFPGAVEDVKTAVRWVRSTAPLFGFDGRRIGLWGSSAGGHLAACAGVSGEHEFLTGECSGESSEVQAVVEGYGPVNFGRIDADRGANASLGTDAESLGIGNLVPAGDPNSFESRFLGAPVQTSPDMVELADPVHYLRPGSPPFLILHGRADTLMPLQQSEYLFSALKEAGGEATLICFEKLKHGFFNNRELAEEDYGAVMAVQSDAARLNTAWSVDPRADIYSIIGGFFRAHLLSI